MYTALSPCRQKIVATMLCLDGHITYHHESKLELSAVWGRYFRVLRQNKTKQILSYGKIATKFDQVMSDRFPICADMRREDPHCHGQKFCES